MKINLYFVRNTVLLHPQKQEANDSLAQQVEHRPFKAGVLGSNPRRITKEA